MQGYRALGNGQLEDSGLQLPILVDRDPTAGDGELEAARAAGAGVHVEDAFVSADLGFVTVAAEDACEACRCGVEVQLMHVVEQIEFFASEGDQLGLRQLRARPLRVDVAANRGEWRDVGQGFEDGRVAYVAEMQNMIRTGQQRQQFRPQQPMRVRHHSDSHRHSPIWMRVCGSK